MWVFRGHRPLSRHLFCAFFLCSNRSVGLDQGPGTEEENWGIMTKQDSPYWTDVTMESDEMAERVRTAIFTCGMVHEWTMEMVKSQWLRDYSYRVKTSDLTPKLTHFIQEYSLQGLAQRFSFVSTVSKAICRFYRETVVDGVGYHGAEVNFPAVLPPPAYKTLDVQHRSVWKKYMENHERFSTHYGSVFLGDGWVRILTSQAYALEIRASLVPYLIYSVTIREGEEGWQAHFNFHKPNSLQGRKREKNSWE